MSTPRDDAAEAVEGMGPSREEGERQPSQPSEEELRAAYEAELSRITTDDMILQSAASLLNIGGLRLGLVPDAKVERDLEQVRDAIDAVRALLPIIERRDPQQLRPLRDALAQLQMAYTREVQAPGGQGLAGQSSSGETPAEQSASAGQVSAGGPPAEQSASAAQAPAGGPPSEEPPSDRSPAKGPPGAPQPKPQEDLPGPGPAESSGRLWVPGR
jgi:hypothetical protein